MATKEQLQEIIDTGHLSSDHERLWKTWDAIQVLAESHISLHKKLNQLLSQRISEVGSSVSTDAHTREVAEKAFEAGMKYMADYTYGRKMCDSPPYTSLPDKETYLNSLNPEGK